VRPGIAGQPDPKLIKLLVRAHRLKDKLRASPGARITDLAMQEKLSPSYVALLLRLTFLAPDITRVILEGRQPGGFTTQKLVTRAAARLARATPGARLRLIAEQKRCGPSLSRGRLRLVLHYINGQERRRASFADHSLSKAVSPGGVPDRHRRKAPQMAGDFESRPSKSTIPQNQLLKVAEGPVSSEPVSGADSLFLPPVWLATAGSFLAEKVANTNV
jgi:hypothetical protein